MNSTFPKITLITPSFNQGKYLERTILSVLEQNYPALEYIIIDGGSNDNSVEIIKKYGKHLKYWTSEKDRGQSHAINKGLLFSSGDIINWLNSDDWLEQGALHKTAEAFTRSKADIVCGFSKLHRNSEIILKRTSGKDKSFPKILATGHIMQPSTFFRKTIFDEFTPLAEELHYMMDHYLWLQYLVKYGMENIFFSDEVIAHVQLHDHAKSVNMLSHFRDDRRLIFHSLFRAAGLTLHDKPFQPTQLLPFENINYDLSGHAREINFLYLTHLLFYRDAHGKRIKTDWEIFRCLLKNFPSRTFTHYILRS